MKTWYVLRVAPRKELETVVALKAKDLDAFCPVEMTVPGKNQYTKRRRQGVARPLLTRYAFVAFEGRPDWSLIFSVPSVQSVVGQDGPIPISAEAMAKVFEMPSLAKSLAPAGQKRPRPGDTLTVKEGPLAGYVVKVDRIRGYRATVILEALGARSVTISVNSLGVAA